MKKTFIFLLICLILPINLLAKEYDKDLTSGIVLSSDDNIIPSDTVLSVKSTNDSQLANIAKTFGLTSYQMYNISLLESANRIIPDGEVTLSFPLPNDYNLNLSKQIFVLQIGNEHNIEKVYATYQDDIGLYEDLEIEDKIVKINTNGFKLDSDTAYIIGTTAPLVDGQTTTPNRQTTTTSTNNPNTLDPDFTPLLIITIVALGGVMMLITKLYLDNRD